MVIAFFICEREAVVVYDVVPASEIDAFDGRCRPDGVDVVRSQGGLAFCEDFVEVDGCEDVLCYCVCCWGGRGGGGFCGSEEEGDATQRGRRRVDEGGIFSFFFWFVP